MSAFTVDEFMKMAFDGIAYKLPDSIKRALKTLESCLEITDTAMESAAAAASSSSSAAASHHNRRDHDSSSGFKSRNRYDMRGSGGASLHSHKHSSSSLESDGRLSSKRSDGRGGGGNLGKSRKDEWSKKSAEENNAVEDEWTMMRTFKATKIEAKTGIEKTVNDIRVTLNKMSATNYDKQKDAVLEHVSTYFNGGNVSDADTRRISKAIFDIASTNKFYSEIYAKLYKELVSANLVFRELLDEFIAGFTKTDSLPIYIDPDVDYDGFCVYSKACDTRKSTSTFFVNCLKLGLIPSEKLAEILCEILASIHTQIREEGKTKVVEESIENVFILATLCKMELESGTPAWNTDILPGIKRLVEERGAGHPSLSNRAVFKCMDMLDGM
jgi:hypothetical protein